MGSARVRPVVLRSRVTRPGQEHGSGTAAAPRARQHFASMKTGATLPLALSVAVLKVASSLCQRGSITLMQPFCVAVLAVGNSIAQNRKSISCARAAAASRYSARDTGLFKDLSICRRSTRHGTNTSCSSSRHLAAFGQSSRSTSPISRKCITGTWPPCARLLGACSGS